jgi:dipeptidyl-peptidase-3
MISNRLDGTPMAGDSLTIEVDEEEPGTFVKHRRHAYYLWVVFHELFGHGTGKLLQEAADGAHNFDLARLPVSPLTGEPIDSWYKPGETWTSVFQDIATSVDECRAECIGAYLMSEPDLLALCGYTDDGCIKPENRMFDTTVPLALLTLISRVQYISTTGDCWYA